MRLGQLARKLSLRPAEILTFLAANNVTVEDRSNTRLLDEHVTMIMKRFAPTRLEEVLAEKDEVDEQPAVETSQAPVETGTVVEIAGNPAAETYPDTETEIPQVIRAPKVELPGLKVLGKIEFPETKKKETSPSENTAPAEKPIQQEPGKPRPEYRKTRTPRDQRTRKNPIQAEREQEALEAERKRKAEAERQKELRTRHYQKKFKPSPPTKAMKLMDEPVEELVAEQTSPPRTILGKFLKWLTT